MAFHQIIFAAVSLIAALWLILRWRAVLHLAPGVAEVLLHARPARGGVTARSRNPTAVSDSARR